MGGYSNDSVKIEVYIRCGILSFHTRAGLTSSVSLYGFLRMQGRLIFSVSSTDVEIKKKSKSKFPSPRIPKSPTEETQILKIESHMLKFGIEKIPDSPTPDQSTTSPHSGQSTSNAN